MKFSLITLAVFIAVAHGAPQFLNGGTEIPSTISNQRSRPQQYSQSSQNRLTSVNFPQEGLQGSNSQNGPQRQNVGGSVRAQLNQRRRRPQNGGNRNEGYSQGYEHEYDHHGDDYEHGHDYEHGYHHGHDEYEHGHGHGHHHEYEHGHDYEHDHGHNHGYEHGHDHHGIGYEHDDEYSGEDYHHY